MILSLILTAFSVSCQTIAKQLAEASTGTANLAKLLESSQLLEPLEKGTDLTFFAPSDKSIEDFKAKYPEYYQLVSNNATLFAAMVKYHTLPKVFTRSAGQSTEFVPTAYGPVVGISTPPLDSQPIILAGGLGVAAAVVAPYKCSNGWLYVINSVLAPPQTLSFTASFMKLTGITDMVTRSTLGPVLDNLEKKTFFVPNNDAISKITSQVEALGITISVSTLSIIIDNHISTGVKYYDELLANAKAKTNIASVLPNENIILGLNEQGVVTVKGQISANIPAGNITMANILVTEGVVHVIDSVIGPSDSILVQSVSSTVPTIPQ